jgi:hypothetical protein
VNPSPPVPKCTSPDLSNIPTLAYTEDQNPLDPPFETLLTWQSLTQGSSLNNFLARNAGRESIVVLDEFEKTSKEIHQTLLLPFGNGKHFLNLHSRLILLILTKGSTRIAVTGKWSIAQNPSGSWQLMLWTRQLRNFVESIRGCPRG